MPAVRMRSNLNRRAAIPLIAVQAAECAAGRRLENCTFQCTNGRSISLMSEYAAIGLADGFPVRHSALQRRARALERVKEAVASAPGDSWTIAKLAKLANLSPRGLPSHRIGPHHHLSKALRAF